MKAMLHGFPSPFITIDGHYEVGTEFKWQHGNEVTVYVIDSCDPIGDKPETQLQNLYLKKVTE